MSEAATKVWAPVAEWYREQKPEREWNDLTPEERIAFRTAYYALHPAEAPAKPGTLWRVRRPYGSVSLYRRKDGEITLYARQHRTSVYVELEESDLDLLRSGLGVAVEEEERDAVAEIDAARKALASFDAKVSHSIRPSSTEKFLAHSLRTLLELVDGAQLPAFDKRDMAKAFREGASSMGASYRQITQDLHNPYTESGRFKDA